MHPYAGNTLRKHTPHPALRPTLRGGEDVRTGNDPVADFRLASIMARVRRRRYKTADVIPGATAVQRTTALRFRCTLCRMA